MLMIIIGHTFNGYPVGNAAFYFPAWMNVLHMNLWGGMGVAVFLFLSGYGLFTSLERRKNIDGHYVVSKAKRLLIPFILYWTVEFFVLLVFNRQELSMHLLQEIATFSIHPDIENWFFKVIVGIYVIMLILFRCHVSNAVRLAVVFLLSIIYLFAMRELGFGQWWWNSIMCFPFGALVAYRRDLFSRIPALYVIVATGVILVALYAVHMNRIVLHLSFVFFCIYAIKVINIRNRILYYIGFNSFIFYFMECPVMDEIMMFSYPIFPLYVILTLLGTFAISYPCIEVEKRLRPVAAQTHSAH